jgi:hypothetical protein
MTRATGACSRERVCFVEAQESDDAELRKPGIVALR